MEVETLTCTICKEDYEYDPDNRGDNRRTKCARCRRKQTRHRRYAKLVEYLGGECESCGYDGCNAALDFHHINPEEKEFSVNKRSIDTKWERLYNEADKCELLCANCHRKKHCGGCPECLGE